MDFLLTSEQTQLQDSVRRFGREAATFPAWRASVARGEAFAPTHWATMAELGWLALTVPEALGGIGGTPVDTMVLMEGLGGCLSREPYVGSCVVAPFLLAQADPAVAAPLVGEIMAGAALVALAAGEPAGRFDLAHVATRATADGDGFSLTGEKAYVPDGASAGWFVVPARMAGEVAAADGISLFLVRRNAPGLAYADLRGPDHRHSTRLRLDRVRVGRDAIIGPPGAGLPLLEHAVDLAIAALLAEALGAMDALRDITLDYIKTRKQFGVPIGSFQALQHRMVDIAIACEEARAMTCYATLQLDAAPELRRRAVAAAKARVGQTAVFVGHQAVQLHGGIGTSDELAVSHYLKRLVMIDLAFGNADHHRARFAA